MFTYKKWNRDILEENMVNIFKISKWGKCVWKSRNNKQGDRETWELTLPNETSILIIYMKGLYEFSKTLGSIRIGSLC